jgi:hypothetical protein
MTNSLVNALLHVLNGICKDIRLTYPDLKGLDLDLERITLNCQTRGKGTFTLDLPHLDSLLLRGLESGRLPLEGPLSSAVSKRVKVPRLFSGLWLRVFDKESCLLRSPDINAIFFLRQLCCLGKKLEVECSPDRVKTSVKAFHDVERKLRLPTLQWGNDKLTEHPRRYSLHLGDCTAVSLNALPLFQSLENETTEDAATQEREDYRLLDRIQQVADLIVGSMDHLDPISYSADLEIDGHGVGFRHGKGAVAERVKQYEKSDWTTWPAKLGNRFPFDLCGKTAGDPRDLPSIHEMPSRLMSVPKTSKGPRLIASEPASHMWCQQIIWKWLRTQLRSNVAGGFINFRRQDLSGDMVLQASLDRKLATVDLSDASDRLSCWTVERLFRSNSSVLNALHAARTRYIRIDNKKNFSDELSFLSLRKFASQGTAATFPVQSICFLMIALGVCVKGEVTEKSVKELRGLVRVFGDDIIIPSYGYARLIRVMDLLQLKVNVSKSYVNGHFRESCGSDGYLGHCVTPVKPRKLIADSPASCQALVDTSNNLFNKGLWYASESLRSLIPARLQRGIRIVAKHGAGFAGLTSFCGSDESHLISRWNKRLHRYEVRVWTLLVRTQQRDRQGFSALLDFFASVHSHEQARTVSIHRDPRKAVIGFSWEPLNTDSHAYTVLQKSRDGSPYSGLLSHEWLPNRD